ncbi:hypothetical protein FOC1_g10002161 [Fusarium oxysporum f. sp. cubense race 1]|uniref:Uncharacterized protein n=1 Tax=Fusarium oxysporum f. sp. cubense (strain race 1) TaxID=1229664 RepID=N4U9K5_FUSC1|nr:hypothetical protein FOC1_g10002161 [Fusarium oxysporum f. sp. cubense race 1]
MIHLCLLLFTLAVHAASIGDIAAQTLDFCGEPDKSDYTLIQDPFLGDIDHGQPGITFETAYGEGGPRWFMVYQNGEDAKPLVRGNDIDFDGGAHNLGTWAEMNWQSYPLVYGGVSVIEGNGGPILLQSEDPNTPSMGFTEDIIPRAPKECRVKKDSGGMALKPTDKDGYDQATREFTKRQLDNQKVSIDKSYTATVMSHNGRFKIVFLHGNH